MKVLMIIKKLCHGYSGAYKMFIWLAQNLANRGIDVTVYTYMKSDLHKIDDNIKWIKDDLDKKNFWVRLTKAKKVINEVDADCCISFLLDSNILNTLACLGTRTKSVICERNDPFRPKYYKLWFTKWIFRWANGAVFQLPKVASYYSMIKGYTEVIPNPVASDGEDIILPTIEKRKDVVITLGRIDIAQKRHDILIRSFVDFHKECPNFELEIYGEGLQGDVEAIKRLIVSLNASHYIHLKGITYNPKKVLSEAKFFILSSDFEGIPNALIEAMTIGLPCISTDCRPGGAALLLKNKKNGILVPPHNIQQLSEAMLYMATHPKESEAMGKQAKLISEEFTEDIIIEKWITYLKQFA